MSDKTLPGRGGRSAGGRKPKQRPEVIWEFEPTLDAQERLLKALEMLLSGGPETPSKPEKKQVRLFPLDRPFGSNGKRQKLP